MGRIGWSSNTVLQIQRGGRRHNGSHVAQSSSHYYGASQNSTLRNFVLPEPIFTKLGNVDYVGDPYSDANFS